MFLLYNAYKLPDSFEYICLVLLAYTSAHETSIDVSYANVNFIYDACRRILFFDILNSKIVFCHYMPDGGSWRVVYIIQSWVKFGQGAIN